MLIARAELAPGCVRDVRVRGGRIEAVAERLRPEPGEDVLDAAGAALVPGLHDHHIHLRAQAAAPASVDLAAAGDADDLRAALGAAAAGLPPGGWVRAVGYHESVAGELDRPTLDALAPPGVAVRVQHRSGALWVLNSAAMAAAGLAGGDEPGVEVAAGRLWRRDDLVGRISALAPGQLRGLGATAAALGVTGFTDATPAGAPGDAHDLARDLRAAGVVQRLLLMGPVGAAAPDAAGASLGPVKVLLDDHTLPPLDELCATVRAAHAEGRPVAVHCVTRVQLILTVAALDAAGPRAGDRIEHGSVIPVEMIGELRRLGVTVVTQPHFVAERGDDYRRDVEPDDRGGLYRVRSLLDAGIGVAAGTDAPFGGFDPWASAAAAVARTTAGGHVLGPGERVPPATAIGLYLGRPEQPGCRRTLAAGEPADLCLLAVPWRALAGSALAERPVRLTLVAGDPVHETA